MLVLLSSTYPAVEMSIPSIMTMILLSLGNEFLDVGPPIRSLVLLLRRAKLGKSSETLLLCR